MNLLKALIAAWRVMNPKGGGPEGWFDDPPPPAPDPTWPTHVNDVAGAVVDVVVGQGWHRVVIIRDDTGVYRLQAQAWAPDWGMSHEAAWFGHGHVGSLCDSLARARVVAVETLGLMGEKVVARSVGPAEAMDELGDCIPRGFKAERPQGSEASMSLPPAMLELENRSVGEAGEPTLGQALEHAIAEWRAGNRDRELRLHLLFLSWYCNIEPPYLTGLDETIVPSSALPKLFEDVYDTFADGIMDDVECLYVVGLMAELSPWLLGGEIGTWESRSAEFRKRYRLLRPAGLEPAYFKGRGAYGEYFAHQAAAGGF